MIIIDNNNNLLLTSFIRTKVPPRYVLSYVKVRKYEGTELLPLLPEVLVLPYFRTSVSVCAFFKIRALKKIFSPNCNLKPDARSQRPHPPAAYKRSRCTR